MIKIHMLAGFLLIGTIILSGNDRVAFAAEDTVSGMDVQVNGEPIAGIDLALDNFFQNANNADKTIKEYLASNDESEFDNLAFAQAENYVNIRSEANENGEILGKLYNNSAATIISKKDDWYEITSGSVKGFIKADYLVVGDEAVTLAKTIGNKVATVTTTTLKVREKASLDAEVLTLIPEGDEFKVNKEKNGWVRISLGKKEYGYVSGDYVKIQMQYEEAVSIEEEQERLREEAAAVAALDNNQSNASLKATLSSSSDNNIIRSEDTNATEDTSVSSSDLGSRIAAYAVNFVGNPYVWGGTSLTNGADCSGFTQSVFAHFGISISRTSRTQANGGVRVSLDDLKKGDLIFYTNNGTVNHVAMYIGNGNVISASSPSTGIRITSYNYRQPYKAVRYINE
jgi:peptidoglycan DL-endopeptidase CwlO